MNNSLSYFKDFRKQSSRYIKIWLNRKTLANRMVTILITLGTICGALTYAAITNVPPFGNSSSGVIILLNINLIIILSLVVLVSRRVITLYIHKKRGVIGSNLHIRLVFIFSLLAALPAIFMAIFSVSFFYFGLHGWLDDRVRTAINESQAVAEAYLFEHQQLIRADVLALATDLDRQVNILSINPEAMNKMLQTQAFLRNLSSIYLFKIDGTVISKVSDKNDFNIDLIQQSDIDKASRGDVAISENEQEGILAVLKLANYNETFIYAERDIDPKVLAHVDRAKTGVEQYRQIEKSSARLQIMITFIYLAITVLLTIAAIWYGLSFARRLMRPITDLINASESARGGNLSIRVDPTYAIDEFKLLGQAFNRMTAQIETQQNDMVTTNSQMDFRRKFTETILGGVSTGVLSIDYDKKITLANNAAAELLQVNLDNLISQKLSYSMPEIIIHIDEAFAKADRGTVQTCEIQIRRKDKAVRTFMARIVVENIDDNNIGAIITFDDLTAVLASQKKAAWSDIARRIAHEIKNPLTPIQLSAERLNRKYRNNLIDADKIIFDQCTETIIRHVDDIKNMVNSFAEFAKMPDAKIISQDILPVIKDIFTLNQQAQSQITFSFETNIKDKGLVAQFDEQQIRQFLTNLIKNSVEALPSTETTKNKIAVFLYEYSGDMILGVADNGIGLPIDIDLDTLSEPYVTHKAKGTGLGLAIVKKIIEDHQGQLFFNSKNTILKSLKSEYKTIISAVIPLEIK